MRNNLSVKTLSKDQIFIGDRVRIYGFGLDEGKEAAFSLYEGDEGTVKSFYQNVVTVLTEEGEMTQLHRYQVHPMGRRLI
jgi:small-conductance mechanosensitive channel